MFHCSIHQFRKIFQGCHSKKSYFFMILWQFLFKFYTFFMKIWLKFYDFLIIVLNFIVFFFFLWQVFLRNFPNFHCFSIKSHIIGHSEFKNVSYSSFCRVTADNEFWSQNWVKKAILGKSWKMSWKGYLNNICTYFQLFNLSGFLIQAFAELRQTAAFFNEFLVQKSDFGKIMKNVLKGLFEQYLYLFSAL